MMRKILIVLFAFVLNAQDHSQEEINDLLNYVKNTECQYLRNGSAYSGEKAILHIKRKYDYFKDDIHSAEDFIRLSATKSTMSGLSYKIRCPGKKEVQSASWLLDRLHSFRKTYSSTSP